MFQGRMDIVDKDGNEYVSHKKECGNLLKKIMNNSGKIIAIVTFLVSVIAVCLRLCWYFYELGHFDVFNIDKSFIDIRDTSVYDALSVVGVAIIILFSNYLIYNCIVCKKILFMLIFGIGEVLCFIWFICVYEDIDFFNDLKWTIENNAMSQFVKCLLVILMSLVEVNMFGLAYGVVSAIDKWFSNRKKKRAKYKVDKKEEKTIVKRNNNLREKKTGVLKELLKESLGISEKMYNSIIVNITMVVFVVIVNSIFLIDAGRTIYKDKKDYKVIIEETDKINCETDNSYDFFVETTHKEEQEKQCVNVGIIVYENKDSYIIEYLKKENGTIIIDNKRQKVIGKDGVKTYYISDYTEVRNYFAIY